MKHLSLFTGAGGGELAALLLGWETIGYVEFNDYCQRVIAQRIRDGILHDAPIFGDIKAFLSEGYASSYEGMVDIISGGFPCQPFSVAGKQAGADDPRNMWPATIDCIRRIRPKYAFLENVPGLISSGYFGTILADLAESGFDARWCVLGADDVGANHRRKRLWILADSEGRENNERERGNVDEETESGEGINPTANPCSQDVSHPDQYGKKRDQSQYRERGGIGKDGQDVADPEGISVGTGLCEDESPGQRWGRSCDFGSEGNWWEFEPALGRVAHGVAHRVDRLKAIGNGQVPIVAATAFRILSGEE